MRLAGFLVVPMMTAGIAAAGLYVAAPVTADCESRNGSMLCTDPPAPGAPADSGSSTAYPCVIDLYCDNFEFDVVIAQGAGADDDDSTPAPRPPRPRPTPNN